MKKIIVLAVALALLGGVAFAADNLSPRYLRMLSRESATDTIDIAYFNPAGTAFLEKGFHIQVNYQGAYLNYAHTLAGNEYASKTIVPFIPSGYLGYNGGQWAVFFGYNIPAGGGALTFEDGNYIFAAIGAGGTLEGSSALHAFSAGGSYRFGDKIAIAALGTFYYGQDGYDVTIDTGAGAFLGDIDITAKGTGFGGTFGIHYRPVDEVNIALTVESGQKIEMEYTEVKDTTAAGVASSVMSINKGDKFDADRPWRIKVGASYEFPFGLMIPVSFKYDIWKAVDNDYRNSYSASFAGRYWFGSRKQWEVSAGGSYDIDEVKDSDDYDAFNPELASFTIAGGFGVEIIENLNLDVGVLYPIYFSESSSTYSDLSKQVVNFSVGVGYIF